MKTMKGYHELCLKCDVLLSKVKLERLSDTNMYLFFIKSMRGGVSYISKGYSKAINKSFRYNVTQNHNQNILDIKTRIIYAVMLCPNSLQQAHLNG